MFKENNAHNQINLFESTHYMNPAIRKKLKESWAPYFYEHVFCCIDEKPFEKLYSDIGRSNFPVNILLSLEYIKGMFDYSDDELIENYYFNYLINYAVGNRVLGERNLAEKTLYEFRKRLYMHTLENPDEGDLIFAQFIKLTLAFAKKADVKLNEQRMDSTMIMPNIKKAGRLALIYDVLVQAINSLPEKVLTEDLKTIVNSEYKKEILYKSKQQETESKINTLLQSCYEVIKLINGNQELEKNKEIRILKRTLNEQANINKTNGLCTAKDKKEISSESLQSAFDEDATYRKKANKASSGYVVNLAETCSADNKVQLITDYATDKNTKSDVAFGKERTEEIIKNTGLDEIYVDGGYYSEEFATKEEIKVNFTDMTGKEPSITKFPADSYKIDFEKDAINSCPAGFMPERSTKTADQYVAYYDLEKCLNCELRDKCKIKCKKKEAVLRLTIKSVTGAVCRSEIKKNLKVNTGKRAAIEGTNSELKRAHGLGKLRVRGLMKSKIAVGFKVTACNIKRFTRRLRDIAKEALGIKQGIIMPSAS